MDAILKGASSLKVTSVTMKKNLAAARRISTSKHIFFNAKKRTSSLLNPTKNSLKKNSCNQYEDSGDEEDDATS